MIRKKFNENKFTDDVLHAVCDDAKVEIPEAMVQNRLNQMISQIERQAKAWNYSRSIISIPRNKYGTI